MLFTKFRRLFNQSMQSGLGFWPGAVIQSCPLPANCGLPGTLRNGAQSGHNRGHVKENADEDAR